MIVFGGAPFNGNPSADILVLTNANGTSIAKLAGGLQQPVPDSTPTRYNRCGCDPSSNRMTVFGGVAVINGVAQEANDTWVITNANGVTGTPTWIQLNPAGQLPPPRENQNAAYDQANNRMIMFGGYCHSKTSGC